MEKTVENKEVRALAKYIRISSRKVKPVADLIRGKSAKQARSILKFTPRKAARSLLKVLNSAIANAENNENLVLEELFVKEVYANQGPVMKRWRAGARGSANPVLRRTSHLGVVLHVKEEK